MYLLLALVESKFSFSYCFLLEEMTVHTTAQGGYRHKVISFM